MVTAIGRNKTDSSNSFVFIQIDSLVDVFDEPGSNKIPGCIGFPATLLELSLMNKDKTLKTENFLHPNYQQYTPIMDNP